MFWRSYGTVVGWMLVGGVVLGGLLFVAAFGVLIPPDPGEETAIVFMPFYGGFFGALTGAVASGFYGLCLTYWTRRTARSVRSRAWVGALSAGIGALAFWTAFGFAVSGPGATAVWSVIGGTAAGPAMLIAGPLTARAARRADTASNALKGAARSHHLA
jgi:hypothetical protein